MFLPNVGVRDKTVDLYRSCNGFTMCAFFSFSVREKHFRQTFCSDFHA